MTIVSSAMITMHVTFVRYCQMLMQHAVPSGNRWFMCHTASVADTHVDRKALTSTSLKQCMDFPVRLTGASETVILPVTPHLENEVVGRCWVRCHFYCAHKHCVSYEVNLHMER